MRIGAALIPSPILAIALALAVSACSAEPDFEERYQNTEADIRARAAAMEAELREGIAESAAESGTTGAEPTPGDGHAPAGQPNPAS